VRLAGIRFEIVRRGEDRRRFIWIHGDEQTASSVLREHMRSTSGRAFLIDSNTRNVALAGCQIDPNRMFSRAGAEKSLRSLNPHWTDEQIARALDALDRGRDGFLEKILPRGGRLLVALHNNSPAYSVRDEVPISDAVSLLNPDHPRQFLLCSDRRDFEALARSPHNVVLQSKPPGEDDGSLSRLAAARGIRYVNIEAPHGAAAEQREMLAVVEALPVRITAGAYSRATRAASPCSPERTGSYAAPRA
jgi:hypothetical protein